jgi:hypothetical protein
MANGFKKKVAGVAKVVKCKDYVVIDYPKENEVITHPSYTLKIAASSGQSVEVSINGGDWAPCYSAEGFWWFGWSNYASVPHKIIARSLDAGGKVIAKSELRKCVCRVG